MAAILWQVPRQMFAAVRAAIYIVAKHRHANICKRTVSQKWSTTQTDGIKHCGSLVPELCFILKKREEKSFIILPGKKQGIRSTKSGVVSEWILPSLPNCVQKCKRMISPLHLSRRGSLWAAWLKARTPKAAAQVPRKKTFPISCAATVHFSTVQRGLLSVNTAPQNSAPKSIIKVRGVVKEGGASRNEGGGGGDKRSAQMQIRRQKMRV